jgi:hypothetical protein
MRDDRPESRRTGRTTGSSVLTPPTGMPVVPDDAASLIAPIPSDDSAVPCVEPAPAPVIPAHPPAAVATTSCVCGHEESAHEHWRRGSDCGICGGGSCPSFRRRGGALHRLLRLLRLVR